MDLIVNLISIGSFISGIPDTNSANYLKVAGIEQNNCPESFGIGGRNELECLSGLERILHLDLIGLSDKYTFHY
jgi:hypothetical protein